MHQPRLKSILSEVEVFELFIALFKSSLLIKNSGTMLPVSAKLHGM